MSTPSSSERSSRAGLWLAVAGGALGALGLVGHYLHISLFDRIVPGRPPMQPRTAVMLVIAAIGIALRYDGAAGRARRALSTLAGLLVSVVATLVLVEYLRVPDSSLVAAVGTLRGPPSPFTAIALAALGAAIVVFEVELPRGIRPREWLCVAATFVAFVSLVGHAFGADPLYRFGDARVIGVAVHTGLALTSLGVAGLLARPEVGLMRLVTSAGPGGVMLRRLGLVAALGGPLLGALVLLGIEALGLRDLSLILAIGTVALASFALVLLVTTAVPIERFYGAAETQRARVQQLLDQAPEGIFIADLGGHYTEVNAAGCRLLGYSREEILGKTIVDILPPEDVPRLWESQEQMLTGAVHVAEWRLRRKDGSLAPVEVTAKILPDGRWQGFVRDISGRLELERRVLESRDFLQNVLASSTEYGIVAVDLARRVVLWNEGARLTYGYEMGAIEGASSDVLVAPAELSAWVALHARALTEGTAEGTVFARRKDGSGFTAKVVCTRRLGADGRAEGVLVVSRDLTLEQRQLAEQAFLARVGIELASCLEYEETLSRITELAAGFLGDLASLDVVEEGQLRRATVSHRRQDEAHAARAVQQVGSARAAGHPLATVLSTRRPLLLPRITAEDRQAFATSPEHARALEETLATSAMLVPLIARGQLLAVLSIAACKGSRTYGPDDLRLAEQLAHRAALTLDNVQLYSQSRRALRDKEVLLREIHHRVKNNLQVISSLFSLQRERTDSQELKSLLDESQTRVQSIALVHEQLYLSSDLAAIDLDQYLCSLMGAVRSSYGSELVEIDASAAGVVLDVERAVPCALLVCELVSNSLKHAFDGRHGKVRVHAQRDEEGCCVLEVSDDGRGIPADFDWRNARSLGLRLVRALAHQLRATLELDRTHGTCFRVRFPLGRSSARAAA